MMRRKNVVVRRTEALQHFLLFPLKDMNRMRDVFMLKRNLIICGLELTGTVIYAFGGGGRGFGI